MRLEEEEIKGSEMLHAADVVGIVLTDYYVIIIPEWGGVIPSGNAYCQGTECLMFSFIKHLLGTSYMPATRQNAGYRVESDMAPGSSEWRQRGKHNCA